MAGRDGGQTPRADPAQRGPARPGRGRRPPRPGIRRTARPRPPCARLDRAARPGRRGTRHRRPPPRRSRTGRGRASRPGPRRGRTVLRHRHPPRHLTVRLRPDRPRPGRQALALVVAADPHDPPAHAIAGVAAVLLALITGPATAHGPAAAEHSAALVRLLLGARPADVAPLLGAPLWTVVHAERRRDTTESTASLAAALGTSLVAPGTAAELPAAPGAHPATESTARTEAVTAPGAAPALRALIPADQEVTAHPGWTLGVSEPAPVAELATADRHAAAALRRALAGRTALVRHRTPGPHSITSLVAPTDARQHAQALLAPLADSPPLLATLHNWLSLHGSWDRTAIALGIHRNTVRQRITRIAGLLDTDLDDPDVRMELWFALRSLDRDASRT